jgi:aspartyl-tRNA(Asn)/glutamyl-tRNA(Gln) amidotransferase subunit A
MSATATALHELTLREVGDKIAARDVSPVEVTRACLERIEAVDERLGSFITVAADSALQAAEAAEKAIGAGYRLGPLQGVPIAIKDLIDTAGILTTGGGRLEPDRVPERDATVVHRLRRAGSILLGKLNLHEYAYGVTTDNPHHGRCHNPWNLDRSPGGSSGGSGASVAARLCYGALGTDTGCSVRLPASYNGIAGIRPSIGRISNHGVGVLAWTLDTVGPMCRTVEDCAIMFGAIAGHDTNDPQSAATPVPDYGATLNRGLEGVRIAVLSDFSLSGLQAGVEHCVSDAIAELERGGAIVREVPAQDLGPHISALLTVDIAEPAAYHAEWLREQPEAYGDDVRALLEAGELYLASHYIQAQRYRALIRDQFTRVLEDFEAIATPTVPFTAPEIGALQVRLEDGEVLDLIPAVMKYNAIPPLTGQPALSVPCGFSDDGMPVGLQLIGSAFDEATLFRIGHAYQQRTGWHDKAPVP